MTSYVEAPNVRAPALPLGTVTFLFTDIEGSTKAVMALGAARWAPILERHRAILRQAFAAGGTEILTEGDSFFVVFRSAPEAVAGAVEALQRLAAEPWPIPEGVKVRMGLHTGEGELDADGSYVGPDIHRAARIAGAAHGGQLVISDATRGLVATALPAGATIADLGQHRLKDLQPEALFEVRIEGVSGNFPPLKSLDARPNNLPVQLTSFVGREQELAEVTALLAKTRLLTLTGPGGTGKTRLSLQLAAASSDDFPDGVWFVALEPIRNRDLVAPTIARTIGLVLNANRPPLDVVIEGIAAKQVLLVIDNFEQVADAAPVVAEILRGCPKVRIVATSRVALRVSGEQEYEVPGLPTPPDVSRMSRLERENLPPELRNPAVASIAHFEAVRLFIARAMAVRPDFGATDENAAAIAQICARLHGMPLAIELAAVRVKLLTPAQILDRLERQLTVLTSGARDLPPRQQTLRGAIAWSYELLEPRLQRFMTTLAMFSGGWDFDAAEALCPTGLGSVDVLDGLTELVDHSLVRRRETAEGVRFEMFPTIREFALEQLASAGDDAAMLARHAAYYLSFAEAAAPKLFGADQRLWLDRFEREHDNIRAALGWAVVRPEPEMAVRIAFATWRFWQMRGYLQEARMRLDALVGKSWVLPDKWEARLFEALGGVEYWQADYAASAASYNRALAIWQRLGDEEEIANAIYNSAFNELLPLMMGGASPSEFSPEKRERVLQLCAEALDIYRRKGNRAGEGNIVWGIGTFHYFVGEWEKAAGYLGTSLAIFREVGERRMEAWALHLLALNALKLHDVTAAHESGRSALRMFHAAGDLSGVAMILNVLSVASLVDGDRNRAGTLLGAAERLYRTTGATLAAQVDQMTGVNVGTALSAAEVEALRSAGARMSVDEAVRYALGNPPG